MKRLHYKYLILILAFAIFLDLLSTHQIANLLSREGVSIVEIANAENNPIISFFWVQTNNIILGEILDFVVKIGIVIIGLNLLLRWEKIPTSYETFIFSIILVGSWYFFYFGFVQNTIYLYLGRRFDSTLEIIGLAISFLIGIVGLLIAKMNEKKYTIKLEY